MPKFSHPLTPLLLATVVFPALLSCAAGRGTAAGLRLEKIRVDGRERSYYLHLPAGVRSARLPVLIALHGGGRGDGDELAQRSGYSELADREGFIAVYPNGVSGQWNDGRGKTFRSGDDLASVDDTAFIAALIDAVIREHRGDPRRVYVTGLSNGGMMTLRLGCEIGDKLAAIAPVIANMPRNIAATCRPRAPLPVLLMNGTADPLVPWNGGAVRFLRREMGEVLSTAETVQFWVQHNRCDTVPRVEMLPDRDPDDHSTVTVSTYRCAGGNEVILYAVEGGGHQFPGSHTRDLPRLVGPKNNDINGPQVIWEFLRRHVR